MDNCIFCKIVNKEIPSHVVYEDENSLAILDIFPTKEGQTVIFPKKHFPSNFTDVDSHTVSETLLTAQKTAKILQEKLGYERSFILIQGLGVNHFHIKIYPMFQGDTEDINVFGPQEPASEEDLQHVMMKIKA